MKKDIASHNNIIDFRERAAQYIKLEGQYDTEGLYQGTHRFWDESGRIKFEAEFKDGVQISAITYFPNGKPESEKHFLKGQLHGPEKYWRPGGQIKKELNWNEGVKHGIHKEYYGDGQLKSEKRFDAGKLVEEKKWDVSGVEV